MVKIGRSGKYIVLRGINHRVKFSVSDNIKWVEHCRGNKLDTDKGGTVKLPQI